MKRRADASYGRLTPPDVGFALSGGWHRRRRRRPCRSSNRPPSSCRLLERRAQRISVRNRRAAGLVAERGDCPPAWDGRAPSGAPGKRATGPVPTRPRISPEKTLDPGTPLAPLLRPGVVGPVEFLVALVGLRGFSGWIRASGSPAFRRETWREGPTRPSSTHHGREAASLPESEPRPRAMKPRVPQVQTLGRDPADLFSPNRERT